MEWDTIADALYWEDRGTDHQSCAESYSSGYLNGCRAMYKALTGKDWVRVPFDLETKQVRSD